MQLEKRDWTVLIVIAISSSVLFLPMFFDSEEHDDIEFDALDLEPIEFEFSKFPKLDRSATKAGYDEVRAIVDEDGFLVESKVRMGQPILKAPTADTQVWAVQINSFKEIVEAKALRTTLAEASITSWITSSKADIGEIHTVASGPFLDESEAQTVVDKISDTLQLPAVIMEFGH